jgi:hypothetical protein
LTTGDEAGGRWVEAGSREEEDRHKFTGDGR